MNHVIVIWFLNLTFRKQAPRIRSFEINYYFHLRFQHNLRFFLLLLHTNLCSTVFQQYSRTFFPFFLFLLMSATRRKRELGLGGAAKSRASSTCLKKNGIHRIKFFLVLFL